MPSLEEMLVGLREECGATASAIVSKDGLVIAADMPEGISKETFGIMSATIMGASVTAAVELKKEIPSRIIAESEGTRTIIFNATRREILVVVVPSSQDLNHVEACSQRILEEMEKR